MKKTFTYIFAALALGFSANAQSDCSNAIPIEMGYYESGIITGSIAEASACSSAGLANWFSFVPSETGELLLTSSLEDNGNWDSNVNILSGECGNLSCLDGDDDGGTGFTSDLTFEFEAGTTYYIVWDNRWTSSSGTFYLGLSEEVKGYVDPSGGGGGGGSLPPTLITYQTQNIPNLITGNCVVDMNGDYLDDVVSASSSSISVSYQQEDGSFQQGIIATNGAQNSPSWSIAAGDFDNNGYNDLIYGGGSGVSIMMRSDDGDSASEFTTNDYVFSQRSNAVDINNDGLLDAFVCHDVEPNVYYISDGNGGFTFNQGGLSDTPNGGNYGSIWIDYNNDCLVDLFIAKCRGGNVPENINQMFRNNGDGTFTEVSEEINLADNIQTWSSAWADFDNDGDMDVYVGASSSTNGSSKMMRNDDGIFVDITSETGIENTVPLGIQHTAHDFDNDGFVDIKLTGSTFLLNNGDMTFTHSNSIAGHGAVGDLNNDGYLDIVGNGGVYFHEGGENNWVKINTIGTESNKNGIGARVSVQTANGTQIRDVKSGDAFSPMSSITAHFGLGSEEAIEQITICWPSGNQTIIESPEINTTHNIVEIDGTIESVSEQLAKSFSLYPNPTEDFLRIDSELNLNSLVFTIIDQTGRTVSREMIKDNQIDVAHLAPGSYFIQIEANGAYFQSQFVKR